MSTKIYSLEIVKEHNKPEDLWIVIEGKVYDVTKFRIEHPGGEDTLDECGGRDATKDFIDVGHSDEAREMMIKYYIGDLEKKSKQLPVREISIAVGALVAGIAAVFILKRLLFSRH